MALGIRRAAGDRAAPPSGLAAAAFAATLALLGACSGGKEQAKPPPVPEVTVTEVVQRDVPVGAELTGTTKGNVDVEIRARVEGFLKSINYEEGSMVKKGQLLFTIDDEQYRTKLAEAKGDLARAESRLSKATLDVRRYTPLARIWTSTFPFVVPVSSAPTGTSRWTTSVTWTSGGGGAFASSFLEQAESAASAPAAMAATCTASERARRGGGRRVRRAMRPRWVG